MLDLRHVLAAFDETTAGLARRNPAAAAALAPIAELGKLRLELIRSLETKAAQRNAESDAMAKADKKSPEFAERRESLKRLSGEVKEEEKRLGELEARIEDVLLSVPNVPDASVPAGGSGDDNVVLRSWGEKPVFGFAPKDHVDLGTKLGILDLERAAKLSGARFAVLLGLGAKLERALITFMLDLHTDVHGYREVQPPLLVKASALVGTGQLPKFKEDLFRTEKKDEESAFDLYLIPTAEVPVTNLHADEILDEAALPVAYVAYTPCFRAEAGSHGRDVRGLVRQHQFDKVEVVRFTTPEASAAEHEKLTGHAEEVLKRLGLHFRTVSLCGGDLGFSAKKTYDLEVWLPSQGTFREISSCSNFGDYQARRAKIRYRPSPAGATAKDKPKPRFVHTLNGSGLAVGRTLIAVLENYQQADGSVVVPPALRPYMGGLDVLRP